jgi:hypothetical protein
LLADAQFGMIETDHRLLLRKRPPRAAVRRP